jgi:hypothetical protein
MLPDSLYDTGDPDFYRQIFFIWFPAILISLSGIIILFGLPVMLFKFFWDLYQSHIQAFFAIFLTEVNEELAGHLYSLCLGFSIFIAYSYFMVNGYLIFFYIAVSYYASSLCYGGICYYYFCTWYFIYYIERFL